jgi:hypothetical protein
MCTSPTVGLNYSDEGVPSANAARMNAKISATVMKVDTF